MHYIVAVLSRYVDIINTIMIIQINSTQFINKFKQFSTIHNIIMQNK